MNDFDTFEPRERATKPWSEYPIGTKAHAVMGGHWIKTERGWKWHCGDTFPSPGADAFWVSLPSKEPDVEDDGFVTVHPRT